MIRGLFITNAFLKTDKFTEHYVYLLKAAEQMDMSLEMKTNADFFLPFGEVDESREFQTDIFADELVNYDFILYWDKDISLGRRISALVKKFSIPVFNSIEATELCDDKIATYQRLSEWNQRMKHEDQIPLIPTVMAPMTYSNVGYTDISFVSKIIGYLGLPLVIKECHGSFGMQVYLAKTEEEVYAYTKNLEGTPFLYQKFISGSSGRDVRLQVVGDRVVAAMYRYSESGDFRANLSNGGSMKSYEASETEKALAVRAIKALGLDFGGVDLLFSDSEAKILCEVNSNAHFKNIYTCTGVNTAECMMEYISKKLTL